MLCLVCMTPLPPRDGTLPIEIPVGRSAKKASGSGRHRMKKKRGCCRFAVARRSDYRRAASSIIVSRKMASGLRAFAIS